MHNIPLPLRAAFWLIEHWHVLALGAMAVSAGVLWWKRRRAK